MGLQRHFAQRRVSGTETLGERLRAVREGMSRTIDDVHQATGIQRRYLDALESGDYAALPGDVYARNFLQTYAAYLRVNPKTVLKLFAQEVQIVERPARITGPLFHKATQPRDFAVTPRTVRAIALVAVLVAVLGYLGYTVNAALQPPDLELYSPSDDLVTDAAYIDVHGKTEPESTITINGQEVLGMPDGEFRQRVYLQDGVNVIRIASARNDGRENTLYRRVRYRMAENATDTPIVPVIP